MEPIDHNTLHGLNKSAGGENTNGGDYSASGKAILTAYAGDWREIVGHQLNIDTFVKNDDVMVAYSRTSSGNGTNSPGYVYALFKSPYSYQTISTRDLGYIGITSGVIRGIVWTGTKWVMAISNHVNLYFIWSDDGETWRWPDNNPTGLAVATIENDTNGNSMRLAKGNNDDELMLIYAVSGVEFKTVYTTTSFDTDDLSDQTVSITPPPKIATNDNIGDIIPMGDKWIIIYAHLHYTSALYTDNPYVTSDNGVTWVMKTKIPNQSSTCTLAYYNVVGDRLLVHGGNSTYKRIMFYTDDLAETAWKQVSVGEVIYGNQGAALPLEFAESNLSSNGAFGFNKMEAFEGVCYAMFGWASPITAISGGSARKYITGFTEKSIERLDGAYGHLKYTGFNSETKPNPDTNSESMTLNLESVTQFQGVWMGRNNGQMYHL